jgi:hypothetical protein
MYTALHAAADFGKYLIVEVISADDYNMTVFGDN